MRPVGNALELKLCKIPTIGTQSENQTLPTGNISLGSPIVFSGLALHHHQTKQKALKVKKSQNFSKMTKKKKTLLRYNALNTFQCKCILMQIHSNV
ncbi:hypothetical protein ACQJ9G_05940 [Helicobacter pylori]